MIEYNSPLASRPISSQTSIGRIYSSNDASPKISLIKLKSDDNLLFAKYKRQQTEKELKEQQNRVIKLQLLHEAEKKKMNLTVMQTANILDVKKNVQIKNYEKEQRIFQNEKEKQKKYVNAQSERTRINSSLAMKKFFVQKSAQEIAEEMKIFKEKQMEFRQKELKKDYVRRKQMFNVQKINEIQLRYKKQNHQEAINRTAMEDYNNRLQQETSKSYRNQHSANQLKQRQLKLYGTFYVTQVHANKVKIQLNTVTNKSAAELASTGQYPTIPNFYSPRKIQQIKN